MSHLIEDSQFYPEFSYQNDAKSNQDKQYQGESASPKRQYRLGKIQDKALNFKVSLYVVADKNFYVHKISNFTLVLMRRRLQSRSYRFQGFVLFRDRRLCIQFKQKRILFGKQWIKQKHQHLANVSINFSSGQLQIIWPQMFTENIDSIFNHTRAIQKMSSQIFKQFVSVLRNDLIPVFQKIGLFQNQIENQLSQKKKRVSEDSFHNGQTEKQTERIMKYLFMSTIIDSFDRDKQTFRQIQTISVKEKQNIIKIQNNIDKSFANLSNELNLFTTNALKNVLKKLLHFGIIQSEQKRVLEQCLSNQESKNRFANRRQFIFNCIGIIAIENKKKFIGSGGSSNIFLTKTKFHYIFSDDPQYWIEQNKKLTNNIMQKLFVIKQAKKGCQQNLRHENQIVKQMKGGFSIFLPKYYKIQTASFQNEKSRNQNLLIIDYLRGDSLDVYAEKCNETLSFWSKIFLIRNIVNGLRFIAGYKIVHLDLKPVNIIVTSDLLTKIIDFGEAYHPKICKQTYVPGITLPYACPEIFSKRRVNYDQKCDIFSLGVIMYELFLRRPIFQIQKEKILQIYEKGNYLKKFFVSPEQFESEDLSSIFTIIFQLTMRCLDPQPEARPTINWISIIIGQVLMYFREK